MDTDSTTKQRRSQGGSHGWAQGFFFFVIIFCGGNAAWSREVKPTVRVSAWYWLNAAPKADWEGDFVTMKNLGITDVLLCWGLDLGGIATRKGETKQAMQLANKAGIGVYLIVWQPSANALPRSPEFMQVDANGKQLETFDVFNPEWRGTEWKSYLQDIARTYGNEPAMSGYVFDDSFGSESISYGPYEEKVFGTPLPRKPGEPRWGEWTKTREGWWEDWAKDTVRYLREIDANRAHVIYLEDIINSITDPKLASGRGLDFARVARHFDAVGGYTCPVWTTNANSDQKVLKLTVERDSKCSQNGRAGQGHRLHVLVGKYCGGTESWRGGISHGKRDSANLRRSVEARGAPPGHVWVSDW